MLVMTKLITAIAITITVITVFIASYVFSKKNLNRNNYGNRTQKNS